MRKFCQNFHTQWATVLKSKTLPPNWNNTKNYFLCATAAPHRHRRRDEFGNVFQLLLNYSRLPFRLHFGRIITLKLPQNVAKAICSQKRCFFFKDTLKLLNWASQWLKCWKWCRRIGKSTSDLDFPTEIHKQSTGHTMVLPQFLPTGRGWGHRHPYVFFCQIHCLALQKILEDY